jgi:hypothetical protein
MDDTTETPSAGADSAMPANGALSATLAGLQAGMLGVLWMLAWLGINSALDRRGFWSQENLFASAFYGNAMVVGFGAKTMPGLALYLTIYSLLGCVFALLLRGRFHSFRTVVAALVFALGWFYLSFHVLWKSVMPLVYLLYSDRPMVVGHLIYGVCLARFPGYLPGARARTGARFPAAIPPQEPALTLPEPMAAIAQGEPPPGGSSTDEPARPQA